MITARMLMPSLICSVIGLSYCSYHAFAPVEETVEMPLVAPQIDSEAHIDLIPCPTSDTQIQGRQMLRMVRYEVTKSPIRHWYHHGKSPMDADHLRKTVHAVLNHLPQVKSGGNMEKLVIETANAETEGGHFDYPWRSKGDYGVFQLRKSTVKDTLTWLKSVHPDVHEAVMSFYDRKKSWDENLDHNVPLGAALCATYYWRACPEAKITTKKQRAAVWKKYYNTHKGKGSVSAYLKRNNDIG